MSDRITTTCRVPVAGGHWAIVDACDYEAVMAAGPWCMSSSGRYPQRSLRGVHGRMTTQYMHRFLMLPELAEGQVVDHIDGDGFNNARSNLRVASHRQNCRNQALRSDNTSGFKGVHWMARNKKFRATIGGRGNSESLGLYVSAEDAARAYDRAALRRWGEFARTNFPRSDYVDD